MVLLVNKKGEGVVLLSTPRARVPPLCEAGQPKKTGAAAAGTPTQPRGNAQGEEPAAEQAADYAAAARARVAAAAMAQEEEEEEEAPLVQVPAARPAQARAPTLLSRVWQYKRVLE